MNSLEYLSICFPSCHYNSIIRLPYTRNGIQIAPFGHTIRLVAKLMELELAVFWNNDDYLMVSKVLIEQKYMERTCGLCGNYDGQELNEFLSEGQLLDPYKYATLQKMDDPAEICPFEEMIVPNVPRKKYLISSPRDKAVSTNPNPVAAAQLGVKRGRKEHPPPPYLDTGISTQSEIYDPPRQNSLNHCVLQLWENVQLTKSTKNVVLPVSEHVPIQNTPVPATVHMAASVQKVNGPNSTVLDDISRNKTCVPIEQCPCTLNGEKYAPGEVMEATCRSWPYRFHGVCTYIIMKVVYLIKNKMKSPMLPYNGTLMAMYERSGYSSSETSLAAIIYVSGKDKIVISKNEVLTDDDELKWLPYKSGDITIFRQSSTHIQMVTTFGLEMVIQILPLFQVYIKAGLQFRGNTRGLCGNYNGETADDFMTSMDIIEGTAPLFVDSWRSGNCPPSIERDTDPCSMSQLNKMCAETHCSVLVKKDTIFEKCHPLVNPVPFYKRCVYQACNYEETFPYICSALASYARVCASMGLFLGNWRSTVDNCTIACTGNQTFSYNTQACDRTCLSLSNREIECHPADIPIDGCNCPKGTYLNHKNQCVRKSQCPCYLKDRKFIQADQSTMIGGITCYCINGNLSCTGKPVDPAENCKSPKKYVSCPATSGSKYGAACAPTCQMLATGIQCVPSKCESGCVCAAGLYEKLDGTCVSPDECPCEYGGISYGKGEQIQTECKTCTCARGKWKCIQNAKCSSTCSLYGEGHVTTFDGQRYVFDGNCEYILAMDGCGMSGSPHKFKIVTENVVCGNTGVTCSRSIKIHLGNLTITLADRSYTIIGWNPNTEYFIEENALYLVVEISIPGKYDMTLVWNRHMNIFVKIFREAKDHLCGLCGNYNGNIRDDFETRSRYVASNELEFVNSWKEDPLCGDVFFVTDPCGTNPYRHAWAQKKCSIIHSDIFSACHSKVYHKPYYEACVHDSCGCDTGGDCECMCDAIAVYAKACLDVGVCIDWRTPDFCPVYCDFFNSHKKSDVVGTFHYFSNELNCTWHYRPCKCLNMSTSVNVNIEGNILYIFLKYNFTLANCSGNYIVQRIVH
ncbi:hypothetical protein JD844_021945 [Phrynosoma platyrhinos]|uniref:VWFD domain-containing protein n=1 Tax=Phrynosoma platyrhinos TaxID=52577 RepID=A0ABQ7SUL4_PHRPL|nr:hypothetical protein JD844_021945 [Phrynosoma platyrhinos]